MGNKRGRGGHGCNISTPLSVSVDPSLMARNWNLKNCIEGPGCLFYSPWNSNRFFLPQFTLNYIMLKLLLHSLDHLTKCKRHKKTKQILRHLVGLALVNGYIFALTTVQALYWNKGGFCCCVLCFEIWNMAGSQPYTLSNYFRYSRIKETLHAFCRRVVFEKTLTRAALLLRVVNHYEYLF